MVQELLNVLTRVTDIAFSDTVDSILGFIKGSLLAAFDRVRPL